MDRREEKQLERIKSMMEDDEKKEQAVTHEGSEEKSGMEVKKPTKDNTSRKVGIADIRYYYNKKWPPI